MAAKFLQSVTRIRRAETAERRVRLNFHPNRRRGWRNVVMAIETRPIKKPRRSLDTRDTQLRSQAEIVAAQLRFSRLLEEAAEN